MKCVVVVFLCLLTDILSAPAGKNDDGKSCAKFFPVVKDQSTIGRCNSYTIVNLDEHRLPKMILEYKCSPVCSCCAIEQKDHHYKCTAVFTTIPVSFNNGTTSDFTFQSDCLCIKNGDSCIS